MLASDATASACSSSFSTPVTALYPSNAYPALISDPAGEEPREISEGVQLMAPMIVYWQETDLLHFDPGYAATLAARLDIDFTPTATSGTTPSTSATSSADYGGERSSQPDLSIAAKAGIGVGVAIAAILIVVAGLVLYRRYVRKKAKLDRKAALQNEQPELVQTRAA
ncbi:uncharacterized protein J4E84_007571 [Alternaria hordeiaustralica]|uniref:uncharacterized protein n=1 Tax=Alternaria hordeiaustralica TaxID=1187925 RepID=UPI0020C2BC19|nr:uncharacterized protein J4E84_007571 [Alternaria hordeiaustralica]KAI4681335.1 hypothetical protein J4E84_007571 [Alternaria hordeiaustralica]